jgi:predicted permease
MVSFLVIRSRIRGLFMRNHLNQRLDEELQTHIEMLVEEEVRRGASPEDARRLSRLRFGGLDQTRESVYDARAFWLESSWQDLRYAWRRVRATPLFSILAVLSLALGMGATTAIYSLVRSILGPPPGVPNIGSIVNVYHWPRGNPQIIGLSYGDYQDFRSRQTVFQDVTAWSFFHQAFTANGQAETSFGEIVGGEYFQLLGVNAQLGRTIQPGDDVPGAPPVVVISHGVWQRMFGGAPDAVGRAIKINGNNFEIVGVAPQAFSGLFNSGLTPSALWVPLASAPLFQGAHLGNLDQNERSHRWLMVKGRLKSGRTMAEAAAEVRRIGAQLDVAYPIGQDLEAGTRPPYDVSRPWSVRKAAEIHMSEMVDTIAGTMAATIMAAVGLVLLVACTNIANLMLARGSGRRHELAVRMALGASRWGLIRGLLAECGILAVAGGIAGLGIARWLLIMLGNDLEINGNVLHIMPSLDIAAVSVTAAAAFLALLVAGLAPAVQTTRTDIRSALTTDGFHGARPRWRGRRVLIAAQVAVSVILLSITALCISQIQQQSHLNSGVDLEHLAVAEVNFSEQGYEEARVRQIVGAVLDQMGNRPGVDAVAASSGLPVGMTTPGCGVSRIDQVPNFRAELVAGTPGIFRTLGVAITRGRAFSVYDTKRSEPVIVVNETTARKLFETTEVVGRQLRLQRAQWVGEQEHPVETFRIIGVASDSDARSAGQRDSGVVYLPFDQHYEGHLVFSVHVIGKPTIFVGDLRRALRSIDPDAAVVRAGTGPAVAGPSNVYLQIMAGLSGTLGSFALVLALAGLYGVLSHVVARRTWEIGVRIALGSNRSSILRLVLRDGLRPVVIGIIVGSALSTAARMLIKPWVAKMLLPDQSLTALIFVPVLSLIAGFVACYLPAQRAASMNPNVALREL